MTCIRIMLQKAAALSPGPISGQLTQHILTDPKDQKDHILKESDQIMPQLGGFHGYN